MKKKWIAGLTGAVLLVGITSISQAAIFSDNFDNPDFTNSHWMDGNPLAPQTWSFVTLNGLDLGYHATVDSYDTEEPAVKIANNAREYYNAGLYIETLVRIDSHPEAFSTENKAEVGFSATEEDSYNAGFRLNYEGGAPVIDLYLSSGGGPGNIDTVYANTPVPINFDIFYKLVVQMDSDETIYVSLYDLNNTQLGSVSHANVLPWHSGAAGICCRYATTFNDFYLSGSPVPIPGAVWLLGSGLAGIVALRRKKER